MNSQIALEAACQEFFHHVHTVIQSKDKAQLVEYQNGNGGETIIYQLLVGGTRYTLLCEPQGNRTLSTRQSQILDLMCTGMTTKQIACHLKIKPTTVDTYIRRIFEKLGVNSRLEVVAIAFRQNMGTYTPQNSLLPESDHF